MMTGIFTGAAGAADDSGRNEYQVYAAKLDKWAYNGSDLGANYSENSTTFKVWSPYADEVSLDIYEKGSESCQ